MKKLKLLSALLALALTGCNGNTGSIDITEEAPQYATSEITADDNVTSEYHSPAAESCYYDRDYKGLDINPTLYIPTTYREIVDNIATNPYSGGLDSFYLFQVVRPLNLSECEEMGGWFDHFRSTYGDTFEAGEYYGKPKYMYDYTLYEVIVLEDLISGEQLGHTAYVLTGMGIEYQDENDPPYSPHDRFTAALSKQRDGYDFLLSTGSHAFRYDVEGDIAYSRNNYMMDALSIDGSENISETRITSTTDNPVIYTQKLPLDSLAEYLRSDWQQRKISSHFEE